MKITKVKIYSFFVNTIFGVAVLAIGIVIALISLNSKIKEYRLQFQQGIDATVVKDEVPILGLSKGIISKVDVTEGQHVKKGQLLIETINPALEQELNALLEYPDNVSAQTQAQLARAQLSNNKIYSPVDGVVSAIKVTLNSPIDEYSQLMSIYSDSDVKVLSYLSSDQYSAVQKLTKVPAYDPRLNQDFLLTPDQLRPDQQNPIGVDGGIHKIALFLKPTSNTDALSLLNGEQLELRPNSIEEQTNKPIDILVNFWKNFVQKTS